MPSIKELMQKYLNKKVFVPIGELGMEVIVEDIKITYGKIRYLVRPVAGNGKQWFETIYS